VDETPIAAGDLDGGSTVTKPSELAPADAELNRCEGDDEGSSVGYDQVHFFDSLDTWVKHADVVAIAEVIGESEGPRTELPDEIEISRDLTLELEEVLLGDAQQGASFMIRSHEPWIVVNGERFALTSPGCVRLEVGDRIVAGLLGDGTKADSSALLNADSVFFITPGDEIYDTARTNPAVQELERLTVEELRARIADAVAAD
jgi:hypothetical protein